jgi:hypothetical protein
MRSSSNGRPPRPATARLSVLVGVLAVASLPAAVGYARWSDRFEVLDAAVVVPVTLLLGLVAILLARRARSRLAPTLGHPRGSRTARLGRSLGLLAVLLALTGAGSVAVYAALTYLAD